MSCNVSFKTLVYKIVSKPAMDPVGEFTGNIRNKEHVIHFLEKVISQIPEPQRSQHLNESRSKIDEFYYGSDDMLVRGLSSFLYTEIIITYAALFGSMSKDRFQLQEPSGHKLLEDDSLAYYAWYVENSTFDIRDLLSASDKRYQWLKSNATEYQFGHTQTLLIQWDFELQPHNTFNYNPMSMFTYSLEKLSPFELWLLCRMLVPKELRDLQSNSYASLYFAILTGGIVPKEEDPTLDVEKWKWITEAQYQSDLRKLAFNVDAVLKEVGEVPVVHSNCYTILYDPRWKSIVDIVLTARPLTNLWKRYEGNNDYNVHRGDIEARFNKLMGDIGIIPNLYTDTATNIMSKNMPNYYRRLIYLYGGFNRKPLPKHFEERDLTNILFAYSDQELIDEYLPFMKEDSENPKWRYPRPAPVQHVYGSRISFIDNITESYRENELQWVVTISTNSCNNDDYYDVGTGEPRGKTRRESTEQELKDDPVIFLSAPMHSARRRCFRVSELEDSFRQTEYGFEFLDPDWVPPRGDQIESPSIDPILGKPLSRTFSLPLMLKLYRMIKDYERTYRAAQFTGNSLNRLFGKLQVGLQDYLNTSNSLVAEKAKIKGKPEWRNDLLIYFSWLFLFAMWIRFWKGPGTPYPVKWKEHSSDTCEYRERDLHIEIELNVHGNILTALEKSKPDLARFINELPYIHVEWSTGEVTKPSMEAAMRYMGAYTVEQIIDKVQFGQFCMAQATDFLSGTAFYYLTDVFEIPSDRVGDLLVYVMGLLRGYEEHSINSRRNIVATIEDEQRKADNITVLEQHANILRVREPGFVQESPDFGGLTATRHLPQGMADILGAGV